MMEIQLNKDQSDEEDCCFKRVHWKEIEMESGTPEDLNYDDDCRGEGTLYSY